MYNFEYPYLPHFLRHGIFLVKMFDLRENYETATVFVCSIPFIGLTIPTLLRDYVPLATGN